MRIRPSNVNREFSDIRPPFALRRSRLPRGSERIAVRPTQSSEGAVNGLSSSAQAFADQVFRVGGWRGELPPTTSFPLNGARA